jgi:hypothetical protein
MSLQKIVYLTDAQAQELFTNGTITVGSVTVTYSADDLYVTPASSAAEVSVVTPSTGSTFTLQPCPVTYSFGEKAELTVTVSATSQYHFMFSCPSSAATVLTITGETMRCGDTLEAGETYEVDIWAGITRVAKVEGTAVTP